VKEGSDFMPQASGFEDDFKVGSKEERMKEGKNDFCVFLDR
jgi:hypothetical protein